MIKSLVLLTVIALVGCSESAYQVKCDSGFETPVSSVAIVNSKGIIYWGSNTYNEGEFRRKMMQGEICWKVKVDNQ